MPDYTIIDACLEKVVRPERTDSRGNPIYLHNDVVDRWGWYYEDTSEFGVTYKLRHRHCSLDTPDALAVVEKAVVVSELVSKSCPTQFPPDTNNGNNWEFVTAIGIVASHPDRTTALCLLALRVAGVEVTT